ncbi:hypothetical protein GCM10018791_62380 [Streptomyces zaomyceticus]|nr:hypothetical protein GCM10018791_62380 [Streptomyces zaomyceticus]
MGVKVRLRPYGGKKKEGRETVKVPGRSPDGRAGRFPRGARAGAGRCGRSAPEGTAGRLRAVRRAESGRCGGAAPEGAAVRRAGAGRCGGAAGRGRAVRPVDS